ncbi:MAG: hypothetical protein F2789_09640, partial [Actinobacteria bacterium]|nr:hypothetical protein [Actinomycetota bacterium]
MDGSFDFDVVVVGGGPVGVTMGLLCAQRGLSTMVVERAIEVYDLPRAIVMDDEIQRVLQGAGLSDLLGRITSPLLGAEFVGVDGTRIIGIDIPPDLMSPLGHPFTVCYYQPELEALLRSAAVDNGVDLRLGVQVDEVRDLS